MLVGVECSIAGLGRGRRCCSLQGSALVGEAGRYLEIFFLGEILEMDTC